MEKQPIKVVAPRLPGSGLASCVGGRRWESSDTDLSCKFLLSAHCQLYSVCWPPGLSVWFHNPGDGHSQVLVLAAGPAGGWSSLMKPRVVSSGAGVCSRAGNEPSLPICWKQLLLPLSYLIIYEDTMLNNASIWYVDMKFWRWHKSSYRMAFLRIFANHPPRLRCSNWQPNFMSTYHGSMPI